MKLKVPQWLKYLLCGDELRKLERYQSACGLVYRWNGQIKDSAHTSQWISEVGEGKRGMDIEVFREHLRNGTTPDFRT